MYASEEEFDTQRSISKVVVIKPGSILKQTLFNNSKKCHILLSKKHDLISQIKKNKKIGIKLYNIWSMTTIHSLKEKMFSAILNKHAYKLI